MANSVELRVPFLDHRIIDFAAQLPAHWKIFGLDEKYLLKKAFQDQLPENISKRAKQPYRAPISQALLNNTNEKLENLIEEDQLIDAGIFNHKKVEHLFKKCMIQKQGGVSESENMAIVGIISTQLIHEQFIKGFDSQSVQPAKPDKVIRRNKKGEISQFFATA
ncbi:MAG: asparagine synthase [Bacteroidetes bacterium]|nr:asparagine synthase [Bacteroidota bacterium]